MVAAKYVLYRKKLLALRARLRGDLVQMTDNALNAKPTQMPNHMAELGSESFDQELTLRLLGSERNSLEQIEAAIVRLENGSYGQCEECGARISQARLQAIPYASKCVRCVSPASEQHSPRRILPR